MSQMIQNAVYIPSQRRYFVSSHTHDFVTFSVEGQEHFIDGGTSYRRSSVFSGNRHIVDYALTSADSLDDIFRKLLWGTYGKKGDKTLVWKPLRNLSKPHLKAILDTQKINGVRRAAVEYWLAVKSQDNMKSAKQWLAQREKLVAQRDKQYANAVPK